MGFDVAATAYDAFMGRYSRRLSSAMADLAGVAPGQQVLDVGCGPGILTEELVRRSGAASVAAVDPSESFVAAARERMPAVDIRQGAAESMPFPDDAFDAALAQLVVHFMDDPVSGLAEMGRVTRPGGVVAACVWDHGGGRGPLSEFWEAARSLDPGLEDESDLAGARKGQLEALLAEAGLDHIEGSELVADLEHATFEEWWAPYAGGVGPAGAYVARLDDDRRDALREACLRRLPAPPFTIQARAWAARGVVRGDLAHRGRSVRA